MHPSCVVVPVRSRRSSSSRQQRCIAENKANPTTPPPANKNAASNLILMNRKRSQSTARTHCSAASDPSSKRRWPAAHTPPSRPAGLGFAWRPFSSRPAVQRDKHTWAEEPPLPHCELPQPRIDTSHGCRRDSWRGSLQFGKAGSFAPVCCVLKRPHCTSRRAFPEGR